MVIQLRVLRGLQLIIGVEHRGKESIRQLFVYVTVCEMVIPVL